MDYGDILLAQLSRTLMPAFNPRWYTFPPPLYLGLAAPVRRGDNRDDRARRPCREALRLG